MLSRLLQATVTLLAVTFIVFAVSRLTGDPVLVLLPEDASVEMYEQVRRSLGLDRPLVIQYISYLTDIVTGDFGISIRTRRPVSEMIAGRLPATLELGAAALVLSVAIGIPSGIYAGYFRGSIFDRAARSMAVLGQAAPPFWVGLVAMLVLSVQLGVLPAGGRGSLLHLVLPAVTMAWGSLAGITRLMRSALLETLETDYIRFCRVKGVSESRILWKHGLRNAGMPVLTFGGLLAAGLVTGSVVTEVVFVWPGMGRLLIESITFRDFPTVQGVVLVLSAVYIAVSLTVDVLYVYLNPRLRTG